MTISTETRVETTVAATRTAVQGLVVAARPRQWLKNVLVFAAPGAGGIIFESTAIAAALVAFTTFCLAASGTYLINDALDVEADRAHPTKRHRPIAAGLVSPSIAKVTGGTLLLSAVLVAWQFADYRLALVVALYVAMTTVYSSYLKTEPIVELAAVASGFIMRALAGAVAVDVTLSNWFVIVASFGALFLVTGKRLSEVIELGDTAREHRPVLAHYSDAFLRYVTMVSSGVVMLAYCLWAFEKADVATNPLWFQLSIAPFVLAILGYAHTIDRGKAGAPEDVVLANRSLQIFGALWLLAFTAGVYGG